MSMEREMEEQFGFIYVGFDKIKNESKVGMTFRQPSKRISETTNPDYALFNSYKIMLEHPRDLKILEKKIHSALVKKGIVRRKFGNDRITEWFKCKPEVADQICADVIGWAKSKRQLQIEKEEARRKFLLEESVRRAEMQQKYDEFDCIYGSALKALEQKVTEHQRLLEDKINILRTQEFSYKQNFLEWGEFLFSSIQSSIFITFAFLPFIFFSSLFQDSYKFIELSLAVFVITYLWRILVNPDVKPIKRLVNIDAVERLISRWSNTSAFNEMRGVCHSAKQYKQSLMSRDMLVPNNPPFTLEKINNLLDTELILRPIDNLSVLAAQPRVDENAQLSKVAGEGQSQNEHNSASAQENKSGVWGWLIALIIFMIIQALIKFSNS